MILSGTVQISSSGFLCVSRSSGISSLQLPKVVVGNQIGRQRVAAVVRIREQDDAATLPSPRQKQEEAILVSRQGAKQVQLKVIGENQFQVSQHDQPLARELGSDELPKGEGHMR